MNRLGFTLLLASLALAQDAPKTMNRITVQLDGSEVPQNSFARKPKTIYRAGGTYCRVEEALNPRHLNRERARCVDGQSGNQNRSTHR
jgi:hypothetical protein